MDTALTEVSRGAATGMVGKVTASPRPVSVGNDAGAVTNGGGEDTTGLDIASAPANTSGFTRTGTPVTAVMRSAMVRRLTLPPDAASSKFSLTGSVKMLGRRSPLPIGTLTEPTHALCA